jgi:hypothetical protein
MRAYRADGQRVDADVKVAPNEMVWGFDDPRIGRIRYTMRLNEKGQWHEVGEVSRDAGQSWFQFFEMTLDRKE